MNTLRSPSIFMRSIATRRQHLATSEMLGEFADNEKIRTEFLNAIGNPA